MTKKLLFLAIIIINVIPKLNAQVSIFTEDFETATGAENIANSYLGWQNGFFHTNPITDNNFFWVFDATRCQVIEVAETPVDIPSNYSMAVSVDPPTTSGILPEYQTNRRARTFVYQTSPIDATNYTNLTLDFNWICEGEAGQDYGYILYSFDATNWAALPGTYQGQSTVQNVNNLDLSVLDGQTFYLGFGWDNDNNGGTFPGFIIDDIDVKGTPRPACTTPNQPTTLILNPTNNSIIGSFVAATPIPDNYLVLVSTNAVAPTPIDGTSYNIGDTIGTGTVVDIDANTSFTATGLAANTLYYIYVYSYNSLCSGGPTYNSTSPLFDSEPTTDFSYCPALTANIASTRYIDDVQFLGTLNDVNNLSNGFSATPSGYQDFTALPNSIQEQGAGINIYIGANNNSGHWKAWIDWNNDGIFNNDASEIVYDSQNIATATTTFGFVIPNGQAIGDYRIRIRFLDSNATWSCFAPPNNTVIFAYDFDACQTFDTSDPISNICTPRGNDTITFNEYGESEDYLFTVVESCAAQITSITESSTCGPGSATLQVTGNASATDFNWYTNETGGTPIATTSTFSPVISATTTYWVTATNGSCESLKRIPVVATLNPITELTITPENAIICGDNNPLEISATGSTELAYLIDEDFETGGTGVFNVVNVDSNGATEDALTQWQNRSSTFIPNEQVWYPAISSGFGTNQFVMATSDINPSGRVWTSLESPLLDSSTFTDLTLNFDMYFSKYSATSSPDNVYIFISTDGGANFNVEQDIDYDVGIGTNFGKVTIDLTAYINEPNLKFSIDYVAGWMDGVAIDNIELIGNRPLNPSFTWAGIPAVDAYTQPTCLPGEEYIPGTAISTVYVKPTIAQLELSTFTFTATASLSNGCDVAKEITLTNNTKIWKGGQHWDEANNWLPVGVPDIDDCVIIPSGTHSFIPHNRAGPPPTLLDGYARNIDIKSSGILEVVSSNNLTVNEGINIDGTLDINNDASLVQIDDSFQNTGTGTSNVYRNTSDNLDVLDYTYWSSPIITASNFSLDDLSTNTPASYFFQWNPTNDLGSGFYGAGNWVYATPNTTIMTPGIGYISRAPTNIATYANNSYPAQFIGIPSSGIITVPIAIGNDGDLGSTANSATPVGLDDDQWNLIGNPYPSAIDIVSFLNNISNSSTIDGTVYLWTNNSIPDAVTPDPFYGDFGLNYTSNDYASVNSLGTVSTAATGGEAPTQYIASGQSFFVRGLINGNVIFNNAMRVVNENNTFFRTSTSQNSDFEKHRLWLNLSDNAGGFSQILVGYSEGATLGWDRGLDGLAFGGNAVTFYSTTDENILTIQARPLPFEDTDIVPLGFIAINPNTYALGIDHLDSLFEGEEIYLEDTYNGEIHDLKNAPYSFTSEAGTFNDRFILRYTNSSLDVEDFHSLSALSVFEENDKIVVKSGYEAIASIEVYDLLGRTLYNNPSINSKRFTLSSINPNDTALFLKIKLNNGQQKIVKLIF